MSCVRKVLEKNEHLILCDKAVFADASKGRMRFEEESDLRTCFQRDRDRIIHCKSFRRLKHKTQVFLSPEGDHYRTRLTHTLEVSQIARVIARALGLNEDLTEAIALGHDLGHTPFGHAGERALDKLCENGFKHYKQSLRVVDKLEKNGQGLNLTHEVREGILKHTTGEWPSSLEGQIVRYSDRIAYINHDIDDAISAGILVESDIPEDIRQSLGNSKSKRIDSLVRNIIENSKSKDRISFDDNVNCLYESLHKFLFDNVYTNKIAKSEETKVDGIIEELFDFYMNNPDELSYECQIIGKTEGLQKAVADYIAGMTDRYAVLKFNEIYVPKFWAY
ncbi:MAG: deoxyguanosinetriphosphate triphosphohydrolase [Acutalibacteraceae bacterium]|nr:deoxyguanosinetriphosphate triphosphohydrolase [Acutalibacteraceae bacterium]